MRKSTLERYKKQIAELEDIEGGYTVADAERVIGYRKWGEWRAKLVRVGLTIAPPIDSLEGRRRLDYDTLLSAKGKNRMSLERAREILGCKNLYYARVRLDSLAKYGGYDVEAIVAYTPQDKMNAKKETKLDLDKRRQPEPLRVVGLEAKDIGGGWYQFGRDI